MNQKSAPIAVTAVFLLLIFSVFFLSLTDENSTFSPRENRILATMPSLTAGSYADGSFMRDFERFYNDTFPKREELIGSVRLLQSYFYLTGLIRPDDVVTLPAAQGGGAAEGTLIYGNRVVEIFQSAPATTQRYIDIINALYEECGRPDTFVLMPTPAFTLYAPERAKTPGTDFLSQFELIREGLDGPRLIDLNGILTEKKDEPIYFRTDHHWTAVGAYYAASEFLTVAEGAPLPPLSRYRSGKREGFLGSLYKSIASSQVSVLFENAPDTVEYFYPLHSAQILNSSTQNMAVTEERELFYPDFNETGDLYRIFFGGDVALGIIRTDCGNGKSILVVRDSYGHAFLPFLIDAYETIYTVEPRYFMEEDNRFALGEFFRAQKIDKLLFVNYPNMAIGVYWTTFCENLEKLRIEKDQ